MGGVQIKNCTEMPLRIQLKQVGVLYHDWIAPGETFTRNTGAVHFTINARWAEKDDTNVFWNGVAPVAAVVGKTMLAAATAGKSVAALSAFTSIHMSSSAAAGLIALGMSKPSAIALVTASVAAHDADEALWLGGTRQAVELRRTPLAQAAQVQRQRAPWTGEPRQPEGQNHPHYACSPARKSKKSHDDDEEILSDASDVEGRPNGDAGYESVDDDREGDDLRETAEEKAVRLAKIHLEEIEREGGSGIGS